MSDLVDRIESIAWRSVSWISKYNIILAQDNLTDPLDLESLLSIVRSVIVTAGASPRYSSAFIFEFSSDAPLAACLHVIVNAIM